MLLPAIPLSTDAISDGFETFFAVAVPLCHEWLVCIESIHGWTFASMFCVGVLCVAVLFSMHRGFLGDVQPPRTIYCSVVSLRWHGYVRVLVGPIAFVGGVCRIVCWIEIPCRSMQPRVPGPTRCSGVYMPRPVF